MNTLKNSLYVAALLLMIALTATATPFAALAQEFDQDRYVVMTCINDSRTIRVNITHQHLVKFHDLSDVYKASLYRRDAHSENFELLDRFEVEFDSIGNENIYWNPRENFELRVAMESFIPTKKHPGQLKADLSENAFVTASMNCREQP